MHATTRMEKDGTTVEGAKSRLNTTRAFGLCTALSAFVGCADPNLLSTPRTVPIGDLAFTVGSNVEAFSASPVRAPPELGPPAFGWNPVAIGIRTGLASNVDVGGRLGVGSLGIDGKYNLLRTDSFDMALGLGAQGYVTPRLGGAASYEPNAPRWQWGRLMISLPAVFGINLGDHVTVVPIVGPAGLAAFGGEGAWITYARGGLGIQLRPTKRFAIHPELNVLQSLGEARSHVLVTGAVGLSFGAVH